jgi:5-methylcytosine-specific restriction endonuclease McrA
VSADHLVPVKNGGTHDIENIRLVCQEVNQAKGTLSFEAFVAMCRDVIAHAESTPEIEADLFASVDDAAQV